MFVIAHRSLPKFAGLQLGKKSRDNEIDESSSPKKMKISSNDRETIYSEPNTPNKHRMTLSRLSRTPNKQLYNGKTCAENAEKVIKVLESDFVQFEKLNLNVTNGLKAMSARQFADIITYLQARISKVKSADAQLNGSEAQMRTFIKSLDYPYQLSRLSFKTPTTPHAYNECVTVLAWLCDLIDCRDHDEPIDDAMMQYSENDDKLNLFNAETTKFLSNELIRIFYRYYIFKEAKEEMKRDLDELSLNCLVLTMKNQIKHFDELKPLVNRMERQIEQLKEIQCSDAIEVHHQKVKMECEQKQMMISALMEDIQMKVNDLDALQAQIDDKRNVVSELMNIDGPIDSVNFTLLHENVRTINDKMNGCNDVKAALEKVRDNAQLCHARFADQIKDAVIKYNEIVSQMTSKLTLSGLAIECNANAIKMDANAANHEMAFDSMNRLIENLQKHHLQININVDRHILRKDELESLSADHNQQLTKVKSNVRKLKESLRKINENFKQRHENSANRLCETQRTFTHLVNEQQTAQQETNECVTRMELLQQDNMRLLADGERKAAELIAAKWKMVDRLDATLSMIEKIQK